MQDQGKRIFLFAILTMAVILVYNQFTAKPPPADGSGSAGSGSAVAKARPTGVVIGEPNASGPRGADERIVLTHPNLVATFSSQCGGLVGPLPCTFRNRLIRTR